jgi:hypothetical protein
MCYQQRHLHYYRTSPCSTDKLRGIFLPELARTAVSMRASKNERGASVAAASCHYEDHVSSALWTIVLRRKNPRLTEFSARSNQGNLMSLTVQFQDTGPQPLSLSDCCIRRIVPVKFAVRVPSPLATRRMLCRVDLQVDFWH